MTSPTNSTPQNTASDQVSSSCDVCFGISFLSKSMWLNQQRSRCFGVRRSYKGAAAQAHLGAAVEHASASSQTITNDVLNKVTYFISVGTTVCPDVVFDPANSLTMPVCIEGLRLIATGDNDSKNKGRHKNKENTHIVDKKKGGLREIGATWTPAIISHCHRQMLQAENIVERMQWQIGREGRTALIEQAQAFIPIYLNFASVYKAKICAWVFNDDE